MSQLLFEGCSGMRLSPASHSKPHLPSRKLFPPTARAWLTRVYVCTCDPLHVCVCVVHVHVWGWAPVTTALFRTGCPGMWDNLTCWKPARVGEMVLVSCPELFRIFNPDQGEFSPGTSLGLDWSSLLPTLGPPTYLGHPEGRYSPLQSSHTGGRVKPQTLVHTGPRRHLQTGPPA